MTDLHPSVNMDIPKPGEVPFEDGIFNEPAPRNIEEYTPDSKSRVNRNTNESELVRLYMKNIIDTGQYTAATYLEQYYSRVMPATTGGYGERIASNASKEDTEADRMDAQTVLMNIADMMRPDYHKAVRMLVIDNYHLASIARKMNGTKGWSKNYVKVRIQEALTELSRVLPQAKRKRRDEDIAA